MTQTDGILQAKLDYSERLSYAFHQNAIPVIRRLELQNTTDTLWERCRCIITTSPEIAHESVSEMAEIQPQSDCILSDLPLTLRVDALSELSERMAGELHIQVEGYAHGDEEAKLLLSVSYPLAIYAWDEWTGLTSLPEILCAFVTPNAGQIDTLLHEASTLLAARSDSSALNGYQEKSPERVYQIVGSIYDSLRARGIRYSNPPASFEQTGQRVRFIDRILESGFATCLDISLLFASLMEQAGLHPLILLEEGHCYVGCWLTEESFPEPAIDDLQSVRKRVALESMIVFEAVACMDGSSANLAAAEANAAALLEHDDTFRMVIDVARARKSGIRPLPLRRDAGVLDLTAVEHASSTADAPASGMRTFESHTEPEASPAASASDVPAEEAPEPPAARIERWKQQLLDLTLRNRLLNFRETKQTIPLACPDLSELEDSIADSTTFKMKPASRLLSEDGGDPRNLELLMRQGEENPVLAHLAEELSRKRLRSYLTEKELSRRLLELYRKSRVEMEESGANTLFLSLGFLEWTPSEGGDPHRAPILLVPVKLTRKSVVEGFSLLREDEDAQVNVTLLELLRRDFGKEIEGVDPPPEDESGVDVNKVLRLFAAAVVDMPGWEVRREAWIGRFSFSKFLLWKDLNDRLDDLMRNPVVNHLVNGATQAVFDEPVDAVNPAELDGTLPPSELFCPLSADSSQLAAIVAAAKGRNFVLHGPPGTGKSQTIANLIVHSLASGKRVLFVAEKLAALDVVDNRLETLGMKPFCLALHSNKTGKKEVLNQFKQALDLANQESPATWDNTARRLEKMRGQANEFVEALHRPGAGGLSMYQCYSHIIRQGGAKAAKVPTLAFEDIGNHDHTHLSALREICQLLSVRYNRVGPDVRAALQSVGAPRWTPDWEQQTLALVRDWSAAAEVAADAYRQALTSLALSETITPVSLDVAYEIALLALTLLDGYSLPEAFLKAPGWKAFAATARDTLTPHGQAYNAAMEALASFDITALRQLPLAQMEAKVKVASAKGGVVSRVRNWFTLRPIQKVRQPTAVKWQTLEAMDLFSHVHTITEAEQIIEQSSLDARERLGSYWQGLGTDWDALEAVLASGDQLHSSLQTLSQGEPASLAALRNSLVPLLVDGDTFLGEGSPLHTALTTLVETWGVFADAYTAAHEHLLLDPDAAPAGDTLFDQAITLATAIQEHRIELQGWCSWRQARNDAFASGLGPLVEELEHGSITITSLPATFETAYHTACIGHRLGESEILRDFWGDEFEQKIEQFGKLDDAYMALAAQVARARIAAAMPNARHNDAIPGSELAILQREKAKKSRHMPVRRLLNEIPTILPMLKPCLLMSPLSVAQYLDAAQSHFDLVIFDEASQIAVWDAVGAIARAKQVVIVGDPKQLPPTNFFGRAETDEFAIDDGMFEDLESILDECIAAGIPSHHLNWHYRSRNEGLIAFSNRYYYRDQLYTFPAARNDISGVGWRHVPTGVYDKGRTRTNQAEAEAVVADVTARLLDPERMHQSIGIVTFSQAQQDLVENLLDEARRAQPQLDPYFDDAREEPVFVKNLENVQGDERDVILFTIGYGPDAGGRISMNFGPLNRDGGERRLNVAITRAKEEVLIFSTITPDQIDLSRTKSTGVAHLKAYLEYAARGPRALGESTVAASQGDFESPFEQEVAEFLEAKGYTVHTQVGCSGYRIDLAIVHPHRPGRYLVGIECDGATYHRAATARDRDRLRHLVLEGLGWSMLHVWSTEWWRNRDKAAARLQASIEAIVNDMPDPASGSPADPPTESAPDDAPCDDTKTEPMLASPPAAADSSRRRTYPPVTLKSYKEQDDFYDPGKQQLLQGQITRIIQAEGPITEELLFKRVMAEWNFSRSGERIRGNILAACPDNHPLTTSLDRPVYWPLEQPPESYRHYRVPTPSNEHSRRPLEQIPTHELSNAMLHLLEDYASLPEDGLYRETIRLFGGKALTSSNREHMERAATYLGPDITTANGTVTLTQTSISTS